MYLPGIPNSGTVLSVSTPYQNADTVKTDGIDLDIVWKQSLKEWGTLTTEFQWTHIFNYSQTLAGVPYKYVGTSGNYDVSSGSGTPEDRWNLIIGWQQGPWNVTGTVRYVSGYDEISYQGLPTDLSNPDQRVPRDPVRGDQLQRRVVHDARPVGFVLGLQELADLRLGRQRVQPDRPLRPGGCLRAHQLQLQLRVLRRHGHPVQPGRALHVPVSASRLMYDHPAGRPAGFFCGGCHYNGGSGRHRITRNPTMNKLIAAFALALAATAAPIVSAQDNAAAVADLQAMQQAARKDKRALVAQTLALTPAEAKKFWPIYDNLQRDLSQLNRQRNLALETLAARDRPLSDAYAKQVVNDLMSIEEQEIKALRKASNASLRAAPEEGSALPAAREQAARGAGLRDRGGLPARAVGRTSVRRDAGQGRSLACEDRRPRHTDGLQGFDGSCIAHATSGSRTPITSTRAGLIATSTGAPDGAVTASVIVGSKPESNAAGATTKAPNVIAVNATAPRANAVRGTSGL